VRLTSTRARSSDPSWILQHSMHMGIADGWSVIPAAAHIRLPPPGRGQGEAAYEIQRRDCPGTCWCTSRDAEGGSRPPAHAAQGSQGLALVKAPARCPARPSRAVLTRIPRRLVSSARGLADGG